MAPFRPCPYSNPDHVDGIARSKAALLLRRFATGAMTNDDFEDCMPITSDPAIAAIWNSVWCYYSDFRTHRLLGRDRLHPDLKRVWIRWILFLDSENKYEWPEISAAGNEPTVNVETGFGQWLRSVFAKDTKKSTTNNCEFVGHYPAWPFISQKDYRSALRNPRRLRANN